MSDLHLLLMLSSCNSVICFPPLILCPHCYDWQQGRLASAMHVCECVCVGVCVRVWWSQVERRGGTVGSCREGGYWKTGWGVGGGGGVCLSFFPFLLDLVASLSPSLCLFHSASLTVVHRILHCKFTAPLWETSRWESWDGACRKEGSAGCRGKHVMVEPCCFPEEERPSVFNLFSCWPLSTRTAHFRELLSLIRH